MTDLVVKLTACGGPENLVASHQEALTPKAGEIVIRHEAIGMNFLDTYHRKGTYALPAYPAVIGVEAVGRVEAIGDGVEEFAVGDRVAYAAAIGAYASARVLKAERAIRLPEAISSRTAASSLLKGMTAYMLLHKTYPVGPGTTILVHAAAGGLGEIIVRWAKHLGATVIGTVSSPEKAERARLSGADHLVIGRDADLVTEVNALTGWRGVDVAYDGIGGDMLARTLQCVRPFGTAASLGQAAGPIPPVAIEMLRPGKSLTLPSIMAYSADLADYRHAAEAAIAAMGHDIVSTIAGEFSLDQAADAHAVLESGRMAGSLLLIP
ncbi:quinone oxidoreductase family protein [Neorhizobium alkalisoli]|uniref:NADPH2:quinone reductase n=1 Tax=Neorhizobium alkalisoli TaxID=528178 RepID=A0A561QWQ2_9HYPH|nr:quinone oxidoreductase [Neorhizobium alkalisoli]TWF54778.1 NADPH2:quinone reductase [Neorhizobium alkalisoli]